jgi:adenine C2-methylase RlmN of 23S rRNA A2503 and tRNA A37
MLNRLQKPDYFRLNSTLDKSVNFFRNTDDGGKIETRFVQRDDDKFIVYLSSMTGCDKACRFCHLTQTGQTMARHLSQEEILEQAITVLDAMHPEKADLLHFNFMARGEPLSNPKVNKELFKQLAAVAGSYGYACRIKISTILPTDIVSDNGKHLFDKDCPPVDIYYSLYNTDHEWRKRWMPKALSAIEGMAWLRRFQALTNNRVILHWALIENENDRPDIWNCAFDMAKRAGLEIDFNLVRYNPANDKSKEAPETALQRLLEDAAATIRGQKRVKLVSRVGFDVAASCGMFLAGDDHSEAA